MQRQLREPHLEFSCSATHELHPEAGRERRTSIRRSTHCGGSLLRLFREPVPTASGVRSLDRTSDTIAFLAVIEGALLSVIRHVRQGWGTMKRQKCAGCQGQHRVKLRELEGCCRGQAGD
jgi:hypothetical protein